MIMLILEMFQTVDFFNGIPLISETGIAASASHVDVFPSISPIDSEPALPKREGVGLPLKLSFDGFEVL